MECHVIDTPLSPSEVQKMFGVSRATAWKMLRDGSIREVASAEALRTAYDDPKNRGVRDISGRRFGALEVIGLRQQSNSLKDAFWQVRCDCGNFRVVNAFALRSGMQTHCGCGATGVKPKLLVKVRKVKPEEGYGLVSGKYLTTVKRGAAARGLRWEVSAPYLSELFEKQNRRCALSGLLLTFPTAAEKGTASLDRINSKTGYLPGNVQWVHRKLNLMKMALPNAEFLQLCKAVAQHQAGNLN